MGGRRAGRRNRRLAAGVFVSILLAGGCTGGGSPKERKDAGAVGASETPGVGDSGVLFAGPLPAPAALGPFSAGGGGSDSGDQAYDDWAKAARALAGQAGGGGEAAVAAWTTILVSAGIPVLDTAGTPVAVNGDTGDGWAVSAPELRLLAALSSTRGGMRLSDLGTVLEGVPTWDGQDLAGRLAERLRADAPDGEAAAFQTLFWSLGQAVGGTGAGAAADGTPLAPEDINLGWGQVGMLLRRLATEAVRLGGVDGGTDGDTPGPTPTGGALRAGSSGVAGATVVRGAPLRHAAPGRTPCDVSSGGPWGEKALVHSQKAHGTFIVDKGIEHLVDTFETELGRTTGATSRFQRRLGIARLLSGYYATLAKMAALRADFTLAPDPLVRTHDTTPGGVADLTVTMAFDEARLTAVRECLNAILGFYGVDVPLIKAGPAAKVDIDLQSEHPSVLRIGDNKGGSDPVTSGRTDGDGVARFKVSGAPQPDKIPATAAPVNTHVVVRAVTNTGGNDFFDDINSAPWDAVDAASTGGLSAIPILLARTRWLTFYADVPVVDWSLDARFTATVNATITRHDASNNVFAGCGSERLISWSLDDDAAIVSEPVDVDAVLLSNPGGNLGDQAVVFTPHGEEFAPLPTTGDPLVLFAGPAHVSLDRQLAEPGKGELPPLFRNEADVCTGGDTGGVIGPRDCGRRTYDMDMAVMLPKPRALVAGTSPYSGSQYDELYQNCMTGQALYPPSGAVDTSGLCGGPWTADSAAFPSINEIFDPALPEIQVNGGASCRSSGDGRMGVANYYWTLTLCRFKEDRPAC